MTAAADANVCVIIAAKEAQATVGRAVACALADPLTAEVVVVDDGSTDETRAAANRADDKSGRLTVLWLGRNVGPAAARNLAIAATSAPFITILDSDDYWLPGRLGRLMAQMDRHDFLADDLLRVKEGREQEPAATLMGPRAVLPRSLTLAEFALANVSRMGRDRQELGFLKPVMRLRHSPCATRIEHPSVMQLRAQVAVMDLQRPAIGRPQRGVGDQLAASFRQGCEILRAVTTAERA